ncbi:MAG: ribonuclease H-like domain-containing protein [Candidatus Kaiserbacteria bacterium]|nr:ribonuclease H-like domain-containing protein [Candidatus Kaiserbacteria bacterium]
MRVVTFDIETANWMSDIGTSNPADLTIALVCIHDSKTGEYKSFLEPELPQLWKILENIDLLVGYNSDHFDIPLLNKYYPGDLTRIRSLDIMKEIQRVVGRRLRLDAIADGTLGKKKSGDGAQSIKWWRAGEVEKVRQYCLKDVEITREIFDYAIKNGNVKYRELGRVHEVKLNTSKWLGEGKNALTYTLGF